MHYIPLLLHALHTITYCYMYYMHYILLHALQTITFGYMYYIHFILLHAITCNYTNQSWTRQPRRVSVWSCHLQTPLATDQHRSCSSLQTDTPSIVPWAPHWEHLLSFLLFLSTSLSLGRYGVKNHSPSTWTVESEDPHAYWACSLHGTVLSGEKKGLQMGVINWQNHVILCNACNTRVMYVIDIITQYTHHYCTLHELHWITIWKDLLHASTITYTLHDFTPYSMNLHALHANFKDTPISKSECP